MARRRKSKKGDLLTPVALLLALLAFTNPTKFEAVTLQSFTDGLLQMSNFYYLLGKAERTLMCV
jgi:hypothetical protein